MRCFSCGCPLGHLYEPYRLALLVADPDALRAPPTYTGELVEDSPIAQALAAVGCARICCRRMLITHPYPTSSFVT